MSEKKSRSMAGLPWIAAMAFFMQALDATILNTALPAIAHSLNRSPLAMQSAIISYTLTVAMLIPVSGWLADRFGTRRVFMIAVSLFTLGSLACALSSSLSELVIFRIIQGIGGAMMMPVARLALLRAYPRSELLPVLNFVTMPGLVGPILGPVLGGVLVTWASWHWIFLINIPIGVAGIFYARKYMPNFTTPRRGFDMTGFFLFGLSLVLFSSGVELFGEKLVETWIALSIILASILLLLANGAGINTGEINGDAGAAPARLQNHTGGCYGIYRPDDCAVRIAISRHAGLDVDPAVVHFGYGDVHPVYLHEYHHSGGPDR